MENRPNSASGTLGTLFNLGKPGVLLLFIVAGFVLGPLDWSRLQPAARSPVTTVIATGMLGFLAYEGFEPVANASADVDDPNRALPIAFLGSVAIAILAYVLAVVVAIGHMSFEAVAASRDFATSAAAGSFLGRIAFGIMTVGAVLASATAINADVFSAAKLPPSLARGDELPSAFQRQMSGQSVLSLLVVGLLALLAVNLVPIHALSTATSGGFLLVFAAVNAAAISLRAATGTSPRLPAAALRLSVAALLVKVTEFLSSPATVPSAVAAALAVAALSVGIELAFRAMNVRQPLCRRLRAAGRCGDRSEARADVRPTKTSSPLGGGDRPQMVDPIRSDGVTAQLRAGTELT